MEKEIFETKNGFPLDISAEDSVNLTQNILNGDLSIEYLMDSIESQNPDFKKFIDGFIKQHSETDKDKYAYLGGFIFSYNIIRKVLESKGVSMPDVDIMKINTFIGSLIEDKRLFDLRYGKTDLGKTSFTIWQNSNVAIRDGGFFNVMYSLGLLIEDDIATLPNFMEAAVLTYQLFSCLDDIQNTEDQFMR